MTPDYIVNNWTDELLDLMTGKLVERKQRESQAMRPTSLSGDVGGHRVSVEQLAAVSGGMIKVVKKGT